MADRSWRDRPAIMSPAIADQAARRIAEHAAAHGLGRVRIVLHGGEPLLAGPAGIDVVARTLRRRLGGVEADLRLQTNAVLLDEAVLDVLHEHRIRVGVSLDGDAAGHDRHRLRPSGQGSHAAAVQGLRLLCRPEHRELFAGLLCVVDVANDPAAVYDALLEFDPPSIDLLLPHGNWAAPPPGRGPGRAATPYAAWLIAVFDRWYAALPASPPVVLFEEIVALLLGGSGRAEQVGLGPAAFLVVDADGTLQQTDTLKSAYPGAPATGLDVFGHAVDAALRHPAVVARQIGLAALADECARCRLVQVCGGGSYPHRYRPGTGFRNPSVYCPDLIAVIDHVRARITADIRRIAA